MSLRRFAALLTLPFAGLCMANASPLDYPTPGTPAAAATLTAASTGTIQGYFVGQSANDLDSVALLDLTTGVQSSFFFPNHATAPGATANFGLVNAGDALVFLLFNAKTGATLSSDANNPDGLAHGYVTAFGGGLLGGIGYPAATYVGFEDLLAPGSDLDYNDNIFLFTNVQGVTPPSSAPAPEPGTLALLGTGALGACGLLRRRFPRS